MQMDDNSWASVFVSIDQACSALADHVPDLVNDPNSQRILDRTTIESLRNSTPNDAYRACYNFFISGEVPSEALRTAMIAFCRSHEDLNVLLQPRHRNQQASLTLSPSSSGNTYSPSSHRILRRVARTVGAAYRQPQLLNGNPIGSPSLTNPDHHLPRRGACLGRDSETEKLLGALLQSSQSRNDAFGGDLGLPPACCILGPPAIGKTALASVVISNQEIRRKYPGRRFWVSLETCTSTQSFRDAVAQVLPINPRSSWRDCIYYLARVPALLALDGFETLWNQDELRSEVEACLRDLSQYCSILLTMRGTLAPFLMRSWASAVRLKPLRSEDAASVFLQHAPGHENDPDLEELLRNCDGVPLALSLMSRAADPGRPLSHLREAWEEKRTDLLRHGNSKEDNWPISLDVALDQPSLRKNRDTWDVLRLMASHATESDCVMLLREAQQDSHRGGGTTSAFDVLAVAGLVIWENDAFRLLEPVRAYLANEFTCPSPGFLQRWRASLGARPWFHERDYLKDFQFASPIENITAIRINIMKRAPRRPASIALIGEATFVGDPQTTLIDYPIDYPAIMRRLLGRVDPTPLFLTESFLGYRKRRLAQEELDLMSGPLNRWLMPVGHSDFRCLVHHKGDFSLRISYRGDEVAESRNQLARNDIVQETGGPESHCDTEALWTRAWNWLTGNHESRTFSYD